MWQTAMYYVTLFFEAAVGVFGIRLYEEPRYDVVDRLTDRIEIRRYAPRLAAEVELPSSTPSVRDEAFRLLFAYIAGANSGADENRRIAMTTPVEVTGTERIAMTVPVQTRDEPGSGVRMQFFLPAKFSVETAPVPTDPRVRIVTVPETAIAALRFSGMGRDEGQRQAELAGHLLNSRWRSTGPAAVLFYDAPFTLPFLRRNEVAVPVEPRHEGG